MSPVESFLVEALAPALSETRARMALRDAYELAEVDQPPSTQGALEVFVRGPLRAALSIRIGREPADELTRAIAETLPDDVPRTSAGSITAPRESVPSALFRSGEHPIVPRVVLISQRVELVNDVPNLDVHVATTLSDLLSQLVADDRSLVLLYDARMPSVEFASFARIAARLPRSVRVLLRNASRDQVTQLNRGGAWVHAYDAPDPARSGPVRLTASCITRRVREELSDARAAANVG